MRYYPIHYDSKGKKALVLGGGQVACQKIRSLLLGEFSIYVLSDCFCQDLLDLKEAHPDRIQLKGQFLTDSFVFMGYDFLVIATSDHALNASLEDYAKTKKILYVRTDDRSDSNFILPKIVAKDPITISIATGGASPTLTKLIGQEIEKTLENLDLEKIQYLSEIREKCKDMDPGNRSKLIEDLYQKDRSQVKKYLEEMHENQTRNTEE